MLPALSVAVQITVFVPALVVSSAPQLWDATPERLSLALAVTVALPPDCTGLGLTTGLSVGAVLSTLTLYVALPRLPARSAQFALRVCWPSPLDVLVVMQLAESMPLPAASSAQFQLTVTSLEFQPALLAAGDWLGLATGAVLSCSA